MDDGRGVFVKDWAVAQLYMCHDNDTDLFCMLEMRSIFFKLCVQGCRLIVHTRECTSLFLPLVALRSRAINDLVRACQGYFQDVHLHYADHIPASSKRLPMNPGCCIVVVAVVVQVH